MAMDEDQADEDPVRQWWDEATEEERREVQARAEEISAETGASETDSLAQAILELLQRQQEAREEAVQAQEEADQADADADHQRRELSAADERLLKEYVEELLELLTEDKIYPQISSSLIRIHMPLIEDSFRQCFPASFCLQRLQVENYRNTVKGLPHAGFYHKLDPPREPQEPS